MDELMKIGLIALAVCVSITLAVVPIFADENTFISIYSSGCENCPTIYELIEYDNSNQDISGSFIIIDNSTEKGKAQNENHLKWYNYHLTNSTVIFVEPKADDIWSWLGKVKSITIVPFFSIDYSSMIINGTSTHTENRVITDNCHDAQISATWSNGSSAWRYILNDTITYMAHNCDAGYTIVNSTINTHWDIEKKTGVTPYNWVHKYNDKFITLHDWCKDKYPCPEYYWDHWGNTVLNWYNDGLIEHETFDIMLTWLERYDIIDEYPYHEDRD